MIIMLRLRYVFLRRGFLSTTVFRQGMSHNQCMEVKNRFKGLDLIECLMNYGRRFMTLYRRQGSRPSPRKRNVKKAKWLSEEVLQIAVKRREAKGKGEEESIPI